MTKILHASTGMHEMWGGPRRYVKIVIHETHKDFYKAAARYTKEPFDYWIPALGCFHPAKPDSVGYAGTIRLSESLMTTEIVSHEVAHAAIAIYRMDCYPTVHIGRMNGPNEENLAYIFGNLLAKTSRALHEGGIWG